MLPIQGLNSLQVLNQNLSMLSGFPSQAYYVDTVNGSDGFDGKTWRSAFKTMSQALSAVQTGGAIYFTGDVREELIGSNLKFDISIIGVGSLHHPDLPAAGYHPGAACWRPPASPTAATPLLQVRGRGWKFYNILFDCPVDAAAVKLARNSSAGASEYDASHATFFGCDFRSGQDGIHSFDGIFNLTVEKCVFESLTGVAIKDSINTGVAAPRRWRILENFFQPKSTTVGNASHISAALVGSLIKGNVFGLVESTGKYIDFQPSGVGAGNVVTDNTLMGDYTTADYVPGTGDCWYGNWCAVTATTAPDGHSLVVPAAP
jgi:hypothetical protein